MKVLLTLIVVAALSCVKAEAAETITDADEAAMYTKCKDLGASFDMSYRIGYDDQKVNTELLKCAEEAAKMHPNRAWPLDLKRSAYTVRNRKWLEALEEIRMKRPNDADSYANIGLWYLTNGVYSDAIRNFKTSRKLDPKGCYGGNLGTAYYEIGSYCEAIKVLTPHLKSCPDDYLALEISACAHFKRKDKGDLQVAKGLFLKACESGNEFSCKQLKSIVETGKLLSD